MTESKNSIDVVPHKRAQPGADPVADDDLMAMRSSKLNKKSQTSPLPANGGHAYHHAFFTELSRRGREEE